MSNEKKSKAKCPYFGLVKLVYSQNLVNWVNPRAEHFPLRTFSSWMTSDHWRDKVTLVRPHWDGDTGIFMWTKTGKKKTNPETDAFRYTNNEQIRFLFEMKLFITSLLSHHKTVHQNHPQVCAYQSVCPHCVIRCDRKGKIVMPPNISVLLLEHNTRSCRAADSGGTLTPRLSVLNCDFDILSRLFRRKQLIQQDVTQVENMTVMEWHTVELGRGGVREHWEKPTRWCRRGETLDEPHTSLNYSVFCDF